MAVTRYDGKGNTPMPDDYRLADRIEVDGSSGATVDILPADIIGVSHIDLLAVGGSTNDFDLPTPVHNQELYINLKTKAGAGAATVTPDAGVTMVQMDGSTALATVTLDTVGEWILLRGEVDKWRMIGKAAGTAVA